MKRAVLVILIMILTGSIAAQEEKKTPPAGEKKKATSLPEGYGDLTWGTILSDAKEKIMGKLVFTDEKKIIISRDGDLQYRYGFFYVDPAAAPAADKPKDDKKEEKPENKPAKDEGKLFYVSLQFPYLTMEEVVKKMTEKYGEASSSNIKDNQGAMAWDSEKTIVVIWIDRYEDKPFCRRITYLSKEIAKELNSYVEQVFNRVEIELIKKLNP